MIYTDFSKAFDKVNHKFLLHKLSVMGFSDSPVKLINSYRSQKTQQIKFRNVTSKIIKVQSCVRQGSHLGPILFTLFINDLPPSGVLHSKVLIYVDDVKIFNTFNNVYVCRCWSVCLLVVDSVPCCLIQLFTAA